MRQLITVLGFVAFHSSSAQVADSSRTPSHPRLDRHDELTLLVAYHQGMFGFAELGFGRNAYGSNHHPYDIGYHASVELRVDRPDVMGLKVGMYVAGGFAMGLHYVHYMEGGEGMEVLRPEIGLGVYKARITYAYNWRLTKPRIDGVNVHMLSISYAFRLKRLPIGDQARF